MRQSTMSLFEREMRDQVTAARAAVTEAAGRGDPLLLQAAESHLDGLLDLARRNGVEVPPEGSDQVSASPSTSKRTENTCC